MSENMDSIKRKAKLYEQATRNLWSRINKTLTNGDRFILISSLVITHAAVAFLL